MHETHAKAGLEIISVSVDTLDGKGLEKARAFIKDKLKPGFLNVNVSIDSFPYEKKISPLGVPAAFVFDRENRWVLKLPSFDAKGDLKDEVDYDAIEKVVIEQLKKGSK